mgnify:CR=1 FL=1
MIAAGKTGVGRIGRLGRNFILWSDTNNGIVDAAILGTGAIGAISVPASKPPIEIVTDGRESVVREFVTDGSKPQVLSRYENRRLAERAVRKQLSNIRYPCALVCETEQSVGGLLWNYQFKRLQVTYS